MHRDKQHSCMRGINIAAQVLVKSRLAHSTLLHLAIGWQTMPAFLELSIRPNV